MKERTFICMDLKSFYASVECIERGLDPANTNLVVADISRTEKTICLAVSPALKRYGVPGRARLFEVILKVKNINNERRKNNYNKPFKNKSCFNNELDNNNFLELDYIIAPPQMKKYIKYSTDIYNIYLKYIAPEDIYVYSIDEVFCDVTSYLNMYNMTANELVSMILNDVYKSTGITATAGIGTNMYLCKVAMDILAKYMEPDENGVRIASLDEESYKKELWSHKPITDFWRIGRGISKKLESINIYTMGDIARCSINNEDVLYKLFGINAELIIDHAWGFEPCTISDVKNHKPASKSLCSGQVLHCDYNIDRAKIVLKEMIDQLALDLTNKMLVTNHITLTVGYDISNLKKSSNDIIYDGEIKTDYYGRKIPKHAHGTVNLEYHTSSYKIISNEVIKLYEKIVNPNLLIKRLNISFNNLIDEILVINKPRYVQLDLFTDYSNIENLKTVKIQEKFEKKMQCTILEIKNKYGKNAIIKGMSLEDGATAIERNDQVGGHKG